MFARALRIPIADRSYIGRVSCDPWGIWPLEYGSDGRNFKCVDLAATAPSIQGAFVGEELGVFGWVLLRANLSELWRYLSSADYGVLVGSIPIALVGFMLRAIRW